MFKYLTLVASVAQALPDEEETRTMLDAWDKLLASHEDGKLLAGETPLISTEQLRKAWREHLNGARVVDSRS